MRFLPASFAGIPFEVEEETPSVTPRVAQHGILDGPTITESMGQGARVFAVTAYLAYDGAEAAMAAVLSAMNASQGLLVLPSIGPVMVRPTGCKPSRNKRRINFLALDLEFIEAGAALGFGLGGGLARIALAFSTGIATVSAGVGKALGL